MFLEIRDIKKSFGTGDSKVDVLKGLDLDIEKGEFCVLLGPSGSGKSTLLNIIGGIENADGGSISIEGEKLADMKENFSVQTETSWLYLSDVQPDSESDCEGEY